MRKGIRYSIVTALVAVAISTATAAGAQATGTAQADRYSGGRAAVCDFLRSSGTLPGQEETGAGRIAGKWVGGMLRPEGPTPVSIQLESRGGRVSGTFQLSGGDPVEIVNGTISEGQMFFEVAVGRGEHLHFSGRNDGETLRLYIESSEGSEGVSLVRAVRS